MSAPSVTPLQNLVNILTASIAADGGDLVIDSDLVAQIPSLADVLVLLDQPTLVIQDAVLASTQVDVTVSGPALIFADILYDAALVGSPVGLGSRWSLTAVPSAPESWTFASNYPPLPPYETIGLVGTTGTTGLTLADSFFNSVSLSSPRFDLATYSDPSTGIVRGLKFGGVLDISRSTALAELTPYLPNSTALALSGPVVMLPVGPEIDLRAPMPELSYPVGFVNFSEAFLRLAVEQDPTGTVPARSMIRLAGEVRIKPGPGGAVALEAILLQGLWIWRFSSSPAPPLPLRTKEELSAYLGNNVQLIPSGLRDSALALQSLGFSIVPAVSGTQPSVETLSARVGIVGPWRPPLRNIVVDTVFVEWAFALRSGQTTLNATTLGGSLAVGDPPVYLDVVAEIPSWDFEALLRDGDTIDVAELIFWGTGVRVDLAGLTVSRLWLEASPDTQEYNFSSEVTGGWPLPVAGFSFDVLNLNVFYSPNSLRAVITAQVTLGGRVFTARAATPADGQGWQFSGGLLAGQRFTLQEFFSAVLPTSWGALPASLGSISVSRLFLSFDTLTGSYSFQVSLDWALPITDYAVTVAADLAFSRTYAADGTAQYAGSVRGDFTLNRFRVTAVYTFGPSSTTVGFEVAYGGLRLAASLVTTGSDPATQRLIISFPDASVGEMVSYLVSMASGKTTFSLPAPWSLLNQVRLRDFQLEVDLQTNAVELRCDVDVDLPFMSVGSISLRYDESAGPGGVYLGLSGEFLGQTYDLDQGTGLEWDVVNQPAPPVTAEGPESLELRYLGVGQRVSFSSTQSLATVDQVLSAMITEMGPTSDALRNPLALGNGSQMRFDRGSQLLIGLDLTILDTLALKLVFNDPYLYGVALQLAGPRAQSFDGLSFELLYQRVSSDVGVFRVAFRLPAAYRHFEVGALALTLPALKVDVYTNGDFFVDLGFPSGGSFSESFSLQLFPFIGEGGFYLAKLDGASSTRVPQVSNGTIGPVVEFGVGLRVGLGKEFSKGPLSGGLSVTVQGLLEGVLGWFTPDDRAMQDGTYYWVQGMVGIEGRLYGQVNFGPVKASVSVRASATLSAVFQAYAPIRLALRVIVEASASIKVYFVKLDFSYKLEINEQYVIGQAGTPPWVLTGPASSGGTGVTVNSRAQQPRLRLQRGHGRTHRLGTRAALRHPRVTSKNALAEETGLDWSPVAVISPPALVAVSVLPALTVGAVGDAAAAALIAVYAFVENSVASDAQTEAERRTATVAGSARAATVSEAPFNLLLRAVLLWSVQAALGRSTGEVTLVELEDLHAALNTQDAGPTYSELSGFFALNLSFQLSGVPEGVDQASTVGSTIFPMIPDLVLTVGESSPVDFLTYRPLDSDYESFLTEYYDQLQVDATRDTVTPAPGTTSPATTISAEDGTQSAASLIFSMYFLMLARSAVQSAVEILSAFRYAPGETDSLASIAGQFSGVSVDYVVREGDSVASICAQFGMTEPAFEALNPDATDPLEAGTTVVVVVAVTPEAIAEANPDYALVPGGAFTLPGVVYQVREGDSVASICARFACTAPELFSESSNQGNVLLLTSGADFLVATGGADGAYSSFPYTSIPGDDLDSVAVFGYVRAAARQPSEALTWYMQAVAGFTANSALDFDAEIPADAKVVVPFELYDSDETGGYTYFARSGDTLELVARYYIALSTEQDAIQTVKTGLETLNPGVVWGSLPTGTVLLFPAQTRAVQEGDTLESLARLFLLEAADLAGGSNVESTSLLQPLAVLALPELSVTTGAADSLATVAARYNVTVGTLAANIAGVPGLLSASSGTALSIPDVPSYDLETLSEQVIAQGGANEAAMYVSRFMTSGVQLPLPEDRAQFVGMAALVGQQVTCPSTLPCDLVVTNPRGQGWIEFVESEIVTAETLSSGRFVGARPMDPRRNRGVNPESGPRLGMHLYTQTVPSLTITVTQSLVDTYGASTTFQANVVEGPAALSAGRVEEVCFGLPVSQHWQTPEPPLFGGAPSDTALAGEPTIWPLPQSLLGRVAELGSGAAEFAVFRTGSEDPPTAVAQFDWAMLLEFSVRQIVPASGGSTPLANGYELVGVEQEGLHRLRALCDALESGGDSPTVSILFEPSEETNNTEGLASASIDAAATVLLKTNLSTLTSAAPAALAAPETETETETPTYAASLADPAAFLRLLWQGGVLGAGGFTLTYQDLTGGGLPQQLFGEGPTGKLFLLVITAAQSAAEDPDRRLYTYNNCAVVGDNLDTTSQSLFVQALDPDAVLERTVPTNPPGNVGFELVRADPSDVSLSPSVLTQQLYSLLGYRVAPGGGFQGSNLGVPIGPSAGDPSADGTKTWRFEQVLPVARFATSALPSCVALPAPEDDPYAGIAAGASVGVQLAFHDLYGNTLEATPALGDVAVPVGYTDPVLGVGQWPGTSGDFAIIASDAGPTLALTLALQVGNYVSSSSMSLDAALQTASAHRLRFSRAYYQLGQPGLGVVLTTSLDQPSGEDATRHPLDLLPFLRFVRDAYVYLSAAATLQAPATTQAAQGDTLESLAEELAGSSAPAVSGTVTALGRANAEVPTDALFAEALVIPLFHIFAYGDTLSGIAAAAGTEVATLANANADLGLNAGVDLSAPRRPYVVQEADTLAGIGLAMSAAPARIGAANAARQGILVQGQVLTVHGRSVAVGTAPGDGDPSHAQPAFSESLDDVVDDFRAKGMLVTAAQVAAANQDQVQLFATGVTLYVDDYLIEAEATFRSLAADYSEFSIEALATAAAESPNCFASGVALYLADRDPLPPSTWSLGFVAETYGISLDQLGAANAETPLLTGAPLVLPDRVTLQAGAGPAFAPYRVRSTDTLDAIGATFGESSSMALAERNEALSGMFRPGQTISVGKTSTVTTALDSMDSVLARLQAEEPELILDDLVKAIDLRDDVLAIDGSMITVLPATGSGGSLAALGSRFNIDASALAQANAALVDWLVAGATVTAPTGEALVTLSGDTWNSLVDRFALELDVETSVVALASENESVPLVAPSCTLLLPPNPAKTTVALGVDYVDSPAFPGTVFPLSVVVAVERPSDRVDPAFVASPEVQSSATSIAPAANPDGGESLSLREFVLAAESAFDGKIKLASGRTSDASAARTLWVVDFGASGIQSMTVDGDAPAFFARAPLSTALRDAVDVPIRTFDASTGKLGPAEDPPLLDFQAVDLEVWAESVLTAVEKLLSPEYAIPAYRLNAAAWTELVAAKATLAAKIAGCVRPVLAADQGAEGVSSDDAQARLEQALLTDLSEGYLVDTIVQYPVTVASRLSEGLRVWLSGQPGTTAYQTGAADDLHTVAEFFEIGAAGLASVLGEVVRVLARVTVYYDDAPFAVSAGDTLNSLMLRVGAPGYDAFAAGLSAPDGLFLPFTRLSVYGTAVSVAQSLQQASEATFETLAVYFEDALALIALQNQDRTGIFIEGVTLTVPGHDAQVVTAANNSLALMAAALGLPSGTELARALATTRGILAPEFSVRLVRGLPEQTWTSAKASLAAGSSTINTLLCLRSDRSRRKLLLDLTYPLTELEISADAPDADGYAASAWLSFVVPLGADGDLTTAISADLGQIEIPIPLRACPAPPLLLDQTGVPSTLAPATVDDARAWSYAFGYQHREAAQDAVALRATFAIGAETQALALDAGVDLFSLLAQFYSANPDIQTTLDGLIGASETSDEVLAQTLMTFAALVTSVAEAWACDAGDANDGAAATGGTTYGYAVTFNRADDGGVERYDALSLTLTTDGAPSPTGSFPTLEWRVPTETVWRALEKLSESSTSCLYGYRGVAPAVGQLQYRVTFPGLDVLMVPNAIAGVAVTRNDSLVSVGPTASDFVYTTESVSFPRVLVPTLVRSRPISIAQEGLDLEGCLNSLLVSLFAKTSVSSISLSAEFGYELVAAADDSEDALIARVPILFLPESAYDEDLASKLSGAISTWQSDKPFGPTQGWYVFRVTLYAAGDGGKALPVLELQSLYYPRGAQPTRGAV